MAKLLKIRRRHLDLLGEKRLQDGEEHVEESSGLADVDFPEPERKSLLKIPVNSWLRNRRGKKNALRE